MAADVRAHIAYVEGLLPVRIEVPDREGRAKSDKCLSDVSQIQIGCLNACPIRTKKRAIICHLAMPGGHPGNAVLAALAEELRARFRVGYDTFQVETGDPATICKLVPDHCV